MIREYTLRVLPHQSANEATIKDYIAKEEGFNLSEISHVRILKRSIDARQRTIYVNLKIRVYINEVPEDDAYEHTVYPDVSTSPYSAVVVGAGPGGLFAALRLIELGVRPIVLERGKNVHDRKKDLASITKTQCVDEESNYCFGEGGAGAYSDGKLYTRSKKRGNTMKILNVFCQHGASTSILADAHPHIGTDKLPRVIENMRNTILSSGGQVLFQTKMTSLIMDNHQQVVGVKAINLATGEEQEFRGPVILATGHSARDVYRYLYQSNVHVEAKGIAVGVRLEHPSHLIDQLQYHNREGRGKYLPAAEYSYVTQVDGRGVYSFCMCPGGFVIPAATGKEQIVVNGMSPANRGTAWSNSGMVVELHPDDIGDSSNPLCMMDYQERLEKLCWQQGNMKQTAPAQRMADFVNGKLSANLPSSSYAPGLISSPLHFWIPSEISHRLQQGFRKFGQMSRGFLTNEAALIAIETRTSAPVRIVRDNETLQHIEVAGLFPCGEGAGYAGGIVSAGVDGERCADMCAQYLKS
ncbi:MAG: FAD-binding protein [Prevotella sp.]|nr:FAD-binding protein [Prevotella sp.]